MSQHITQALVSRIHWIDAQGTQHSALWRSERLASPPRTVQCVDDTLSADEAYRKACEGVAILWQGDFQNARQLLVAMAKRADRLPSKVTARNAKASLKAAQRTPSEAFHAYRLKQSQRARMLSMLLIPLNADFSIPLRRAPDWRLACAQVYGAAEQNSVVSLRELLGIVGAFEWRKNGVRIESLNNRLIHPHYGVFAPIRNEYLQLVANAPLPPCMQQSTSRATAFDIGTGTGVLAAILAQRGVPRIIATDLDSRAIACAQENIHRLGYDKQVTVVASDLFPTQDPGQAHLIMCNPPWLPARPSSPLEHAVYDPDSQMLRGFLQGVSQRLAPDGHAWLILSDLAEHLGLRSRETLLAWIAEAGLSVVGKHDVKPEHSKAFDASDALYLARKAEITSLWQLKKA